MRHTLENDMPAILMNNLGDSNVEQLVKYITTDEDDIVKCFNLKGALRAEIDAEFNKMETNVWDYSFEEKEEEDDEDAMSTSSGFCSATTSISDYADSMDRTAFTYSEVCLDEESQFSGISRCLSMCLSMCLSNDSLDMSESSLEKINQCIMDNSKMILKQLQPHSRKNAQLMKLLQMYKEVLLSES